MFYYTKLLTKISFQKKLLTKISIPNTQNKKKTKTFKQLMKPANRGNMLIYIYIYLFDRANMLIDFRGYFPTLFQTNAKKILKRWHVIVSLKMSSLINFLKINYNIDETSLLFSYLFIYLFLGHAIHVYISMPFWQK